jgi:hypothetical protein
MKRGNYGLFPDIILAFTWRNCGRTKKTEVYPVTKIKNRYLLSATTTPTCSICHVDGNCELEIPIHTHAGKITFLRILLFCDLEERDGKLVTNHLPGYTSRN